MTERENWPPDWLEDWAERAAIIEHLANVPRAEAEARAEEIVRRNHERTTP